MVAQNNPQNTVSNSNNVLGLTITVAAVVGGCMSSFNQEDYVATVRSAGNALPMAVEMEELFGAT